jgi:hypothetical protein
MSNFISTKKNKFFFFLKNIFFGGLVLVFSFLTIFLINKLVGRVVFGLSIIGVFLYIIKLNLLYSKNVEYLELKKMLEDDKNEFVKIFQKTFVRILFPSIFVIFSLNLIIFHNLFVHTLLQILLYLLFFIYINIRLVDILFAKRKNLKF